MFRRLLSVGGFTLLSRITGFARDLLMAWIVGKNFLSDALVVAFMFPNYFRAIFGEGAINPAFLPRYATLHARGDQAAAARFADQIFSWQVLAQLAILVGGLIAMPLLINVIAPGFAGNPEEMAVTVSLARITFPYLILTLVAIQLSAMLNAIERFWAAAAWSNFQNIGMIVTLVCWKWFPNGAYAAAWGMLAGGVMQLFFMLWAAQRDGLNLRIVWPRWTPDVAEFFKALGAVTLGTATTLIAPMIDTVLASFLPEGSRTALYYADRINQLPLGVLGIALGTVLLPEMTARLARNDRAGSDAAQNNAAALTLLLTLPFAFAFAVIPGTIMTAIFAHGRFDVHAATLSGTALAAYGVGLPAFALVRIIASTFYARHDTGTPARITFIAFAANIAMKVALVWGLHLGIAGIALGTAFGAWLNVGQLIVIGRRRGLLAISDVSRRAIVPILLAAVAAGIGAFGGAWLIERAGIGGRFEDLVALAAAGTLGGLLYLVVVFAFRRMLPLGRLSRRGA
ncbi:MAG: murein biosynthesis integral membrane protein MurJ [Alphaproteobacteria bacterium]|nr:murein biosynthesis integral membrane protein MurJ [Alphaproteobacteria bacterium]MBL7096948.1 murein biosynthesis integral membrane protein MurJ [Alphaproteobacteria bacterium]